MSPTIADPGPLAEQLSVLLGGSVDRVDRMAGGHLSSVFAVHLSDGRSLVAKSGPNVEAEADMLHAIALTGTPAPAIIAVQTDLIVMERLDQDDRLGESAWQDLAAVQTLLHAPKGHSYGWPLDHAFGPVVIANGSRSDWPAFWADNRLLCHIPHVPIEIARRLEVLADRLGEHLPARPPSALLHGDLWGGNVLVADGKITGLIDPACYRGDREVDIAMLTLFDHPPPAFFDALDLAPGWRQRIPVYRLWPLLVHLRLFGNSYAAAVATDLDALGV